MSIDELIRDTVHFHRKQYFANHPPILSLKIGDYGYLKKKGFEYAGNVEDSFKINIGKIRVGPEADGQFSSEKGIKYETSADGHIKVEDVGEGRAEAIINFERANCVFFRGSGCRIKMIEDRASFDREIINLYELDKWKTEYVVITSIMEAKTINLFVSNSTKSFVKLRAKSSLPEVDIIKAGVDYDVIGESGVGDKWVSNKVTVPLIGLSKIKKKNLIGDPVLRTKYLIGDEDKFNEQIDELETLKNNVRIKKIPFVEAFDITDIEGE